MVLDDANDHPGLADRQVGLLPCEQVVDLGGKYGLDCHLPILVDGLQFVADTIPKHGAKQVVDLGQVNAVAQDDHLSLRDAIKDRLDVVDLGLDEVLHVQVETDRTASSTSRRRTVLNIYVEGRKLKLEQTYLC